jgi:hypothetical protein
MNKRLLTKATALTLTVSVLAGCIHMEQNENLTRKAQTGLQQIKKLNDLPKKFNVIDRPYANQNPTISKTDKYKFLTDIHDIEIIESPKSTGISLSELIKVFKSYGINVSSSLSLNDYQYKGFSINSTDARTALEIITSSMDLDFSVHNGSQGPYVNIEPIKSIEYTLAVHNSVIEFNLSESGFDAGDSLSSLTSGGGESAQTTGSPNSQSDSRTNVKITSNFWTDLDVELKQRLTRLVPVRQRPDSDKANQQARNVSNINDNQRLTEIQIGTAFINKSTGRITIQAPSYAREQLLTYLQHLDRMLSTRIEINGKIIVVTQTNAESKGFDLSSLIKFGSDYGLMFSNDIYKQIQINNPAEGIPFNVSLEGATAAAGIVSNDGLFSVFNAYVESQKNIRTVLEPKLSTTSGTVATYSRESPYLFTNFQGSTTSNDSATTTSSENNIVPINFGINLRVYPIYNAKSDTIRTVVDLVQVFQSTIQTIDQTVNGQIIKTEIPVPDKVTIQSINIIKNGGMVILGGQEIDTQDQLSQGVTSLKNSYIGGLFGNSQNNGQNSKYYFVFSAKAISPSQIAAQTISYE